MRSVVLVRTPVVSLVVPVLLLAATSGEAATVFDAIESSPDTTIDLSGTVVDDEDLAEDDLSVVTAPVGPPGIPVGADLSAYHRDASDELFAVDVTVVLPGGTTVRPTDVVRWTGSSYAVVFSGESNGVPAGACIDAISVDEGTGALLLSFDVDVDLGGGLEAADEDLVAFDGAGFSAYFDGSASGLAEGVDLDGAHAIGGGRLALSFDVSGDVGGVDFDDEDVLEYDPGSGSWQMLFDGSAQHAAWTAAGLDALHLVPEPGWLASLAAGLALLGILDRRRRR